MVPIASDARAEHLTLRAEKTAAVTFEVRAP